MECDDCTRLADAIYDLEIWKAPEILVQLQKGEDGDPQEVNLVSIIDEIPSSPERHRFMQESSNRYYMPKNYNKNDIGYRREHIVPFFSQACARAGIELRSKGWEDVYQKLTLKCVRGRIYSSQQSRKNQQLHLSRQGLGDSSTAMMVHPVTGYKYSKEFHARQSKTLRPKKGEVQCPFEIILKWEPNLESGNGDGRWYVFHGHTFHHGHLQKDANEIQLLLWHHDKESTRLAVNAMNIHLGCGSATQLLVSQHSQVFFTPSQLEALRRSERLTIGNPEAPLASPNLTPAERLFNYLQNEKDLSYCALFANVDIGESLVTVNKKRGQQSQNRVQFRNLEMSSGGYRGHCDSEIIQTSNLVATGETDTPESHTVRVLNALTVGSDGGEKKLLLAVAWVSDEQRRLATCFPEAWGVDVTMGTNAEQRPLLSASLKMSTNQTMTHFHSFLPCVARWAYAWSFGVAMPKLLGKETLQRNNAVCTDGEEKEYGPLVVLSQDSDSPWYGTEHYLCVYHLVDRQLGKEGLKGQLLGPIGEIYQSVVINWIYSWSSDMETYEAFTTSYNLLMSWLRSKESDDITSPRKPDHLGPEMCDRWATFVHRKISVHALKFVFAKRLKRRSFNLRTTSNTEGEQGILKSKNSKTGVRPNMALDESTRAIQNLDSLRLRNKSVKNAKLLDQQRVKPNEAYKTQLFDVIVPHVVEEMMSEYDARKDYFYYRVDNATFWVFRREYKEYTNTPTIRSEFLGYMIPKFAWVRTVKIVEFNGSSYLKCTCGLFERFGWGCRHCYKVRGTVPTPQDCTVRSRIEYLRYLNKPGHETISKILQDCLKKETPGPPVGQGWDPPEIGRGDAPDAIQHSRLASMVNASNESSRAVLRPGHHWYAAQAVSHHASEDDEKEEVKDSELSLTQPVHHEENLSQYAQEADESSDSGEEQVHAAEDHNKCHLAIRINEPSNHELEAHKVAISRGGAYNNMMPLFQQMTNLADTNPYLYDIMWQSLNKASSLMNSEAQRGVTGNTAGSIWSLPSVDRARKYSRKRQRTSPRKGKKKASS